MSVLPASLVGEGGPSEHQGIKVKEVRGSVSRKQVGVCLWVLCNERDVLRLWGKGNEVKATPGEDSPASLVKTAFFML